MNWVTIRCPRCGAYVAAPSPGARTSWASCPHCYTTLPVVAPSDPPPLFSWEVYPNVYPTLAPPRVPGHRLPMAVALTLVVTTVVLVGIAGVLFWTGSSALAPGTFSLAGEVDAPFDTGLAFPLQGAFVNLSGEGGFRAAVVTNGSGQFAFTGVPAGGALVNVSAPGYGSVAVVIFLSQPYRAPADSGGLVVTLQPSSVSGGTTVVESPFSSLEGFLTSLWSGTVLFGIAAAVSGLGAVYAREGRHRAVPVAAGAAALVAPAALFLLGDASAFPLVGYATAGLSALGALAISLGLIPLLWEGRAPEPNE